MIRDGTDLGRDGPDAGRSVEGAALHEATESMNTHTSLFSCCGLPAYLCGLNDPCIILVDQDRWLARDFLNRTIKIHLLHRDTLGRR